MARATKAEIAERINRIVKMMAVGTSRADIVLYASKNWGITERQTTTYIQKANNTIIQLTTKENEDILALARLRLEDLYFKNMRIDDYKTALATLKEYSKLYGLYPVEKSEVTIKDESLTDEQRLTRIAEILDKARNRRDRDSS